MVSYSMVAAAWYRRPACCGTAWYRVRGMACCGGLGHHAPTLNLAPINQSVNPPTTRKSIHNQSDWFSVDFFVAADFKPPGNLRKKWKFGH